jgi:hypothetical protein
VDILFSVSPVLITTFNLSEGLTPFREFTSTVCADSPPKPLDYSEHIKLWEREIKWTKKDKQDEMKRDFTGWME